MAPIRPVLVRLLARSALPLGSRLPVGAASHMRRPCYRHQTWRQMSNDGTTPDKMDAINQLHVKSETSGSLDSKEHLTDLEEEELEMDMQERKFVDMEVSDFENLYKDDASGEIKDFIATVLCEYEHIKYNTLGRVPSVIREMDMEMIYREGPSPLQRSKIISFLFIREMSKRRQKRIQQREKVERRAIKIEKDQLLGRNCDATSRTGLIGLNNEIIYGLWRNNLFSRIPENKVKDGNSISKLIDAALFGKKLIFDFSFQSHMNDHAYRNMLSQLQTAYGLNRFQDYDQIFDLWFCNFKEKSHSAHYSENRYISNLHTTSMITVKSDCMTNYFDKSRLVYLTPHVRESLESDIARNDDVYIIGAFNDKTGGQPMSYIKARELGIRARCFPIDEHIQWNQGSKSLCINHVVGTLLELLNNGGDWKAALTKSIPPRKIKPLELLIEEESRRLAKFNSKQKRVYNTGGQAGRSYFPPQPARFARPVPQNPK